MNDEHFWREKLLIIYSSFPKGNVDCRWGQEDEPFTLWRYEQVNRVSVEIVGLVVHPDTPWLGCSQTCLKTVA